MTPAASADRKIPQIVRVRQPVDKDQERLWIVEEVLEFDGRKRVCLCEDTLSRFGVRHRVEGATAGFANRNSAIVCEHRDVFENGGLVEASQHDDLAHSPLVGKQQLADGLSALYAVSTRALVSTSLAC